MEDTRIHPRKAWLALVLSLITTGLGQVYNGQWKKGFLFFFAESLCALGLFYAFASFAGMVSAVAVLIVLNVVVAGEAFVTARRLAKYTLRPCNRGWVYAVCIGLNLLAGSAADLALREFYFQTYKAPSGSMLPTLQINDHFIVEKLSSTSDLKRGDIVVFRFPEDESKHFVKRIVGLPGEAVELRHKRVFIDSVLLEEKYVQHTKADNQPVRDDFLLPRVLGSNELFLMGDNREASFDSRFFGPVKRYAVIGRAQYIYFPGNVGNDGWFNRLGSRLR